MATSGLLRKRKTKQQAIYDYLYREITSGQHLPNAQLTAVKQLARHFNTGVRTVQLAIAELESAGYVVSRHGSGTFIAGTHRSLSMEDMVVMCAEARGPLWADLCVMLMEGLSERELVGTVIATEIKDEQHRRLMQRMSHSEAGSFVVLGSRDFPFDIFEYPAMHGKTVVAVVNWSSDLRWPRLHRVLHDSVEGGQLVAEHLWDLGHRHVLCVDAPFDRGLFDRDPGDHWAGGSAFVREWTRRGGRWQAVRNTLSDPTAKGLGEDFVAHFRHGDAPTAVFGVRDIEARVAQETIRRRLPELDGRVAIVGYCDTLWSQASSPPFTTVSYQLEEIAKEALKVLSVAHVGEETPPELTLIPARLIVRGTSVRAAECRRMQAEP